MSPMAAGQAQSQPQQQQDQGQQPQMVLQPHFAASDPYGPLVEVRGWKIDKFDGKQWLPYREDLKAVLQRAKCWDVITGVIPPPDEITDPVGYANFINKANFANEVLTTTLPKKTKLSISQFENVWEKYDHLSNMEIRHPHLNNMPFRRTLMNYQFDPNKETMLQFIQNFEVKSLELSEMGAPMSRIEEINTLVCNTEKFVNLSSYFPGDTINQQSLQSVKNSLRAAFEKKKHKWEIETDEKVNFTGNRGSCGDGRGRGGHSSRGGRKNGKRDFAKRDLSKIKCFKCQEFGHFQNKCPKLKREREDDETKDQPS